LQESNGAKEGAKTWGEIMKIVKLLVLGSLMTMAFGISTAEASRVCEDFQSCAEASIEKNGYVTSDCEKVKNDAQDQCAAYSIIKNGYVTSDCLTLDSGGRCAVASLKKNGYVTSDCLKVSNNRQDRCAAASIEKYGYVTSSCLSLP
jgi:hypothetical protein